MPLNNIRASLAIIHNQMPASLQRLFNRAGKPIRHRIQRGNSATREVILPLGQNYLCNSATQEVILPEWQNYLGNSARAAELPM
jgi:hypothetical protein